MKRQPALLLAGLATLAVLAPIRASARIVRVPADQPTIQLGIAAAANGDTVIVAPGTYRENIVFRGKKIVVTSTFFQSDDSSTIASTVIDGSLPVHPDTGSVVLFMNHEDSTAVLQGFTIRGGTGTKWTDEHGAGVYREGGGILVAGCGPTIRYNVIANNAVATGGGVTSAGGGGIRAGDGNVHILNNVITGNTGRYGAAVTLNFTDAVLRNNIITRNAGGQDYGGGAVWINHPGASTKTLENNTIAGNTAAGGGIYVFYGSPTLVRNTIVWGNTGPQITVRTAGGLTVAYSDVQGAYAGTGNFAGDPGFADASFHLSDTSACVDGGDPAAAVQDPPDPAEAGKGRWPSMGTTRSDIGAYGGPGRSSFPQVFGVTSVSARRSSPGPGGFLLGQNYPNPFNPSTHIDYRLPAEGDVRLVVYDALGREVEALVRAHQAAGAYSSVWNGSRFGSGTYVCRLTVRTLAGEYRQEAMKVLLLK